MTGNEFCIVAALNKELEGPAEIGQRFLKNLDALSAISPSYQPWYFADLDGELTMDMFPLEEVRPQFTAIVERGVSKEDDGEATPQLGYSIAASNAIMISPLSVGLRIHGAGSYHSAPVLSFDTPFDEFPDPQIVAYSSFHAALKSIVSIWNVQYARVYSHELSERWRDIPWGREFDLLWMVYLSAPMARQIAPPRDVLVEHVNDGLIMIAAEETFDVDNPRHMKQAKLIMDSLAPLNDAHDRKEYDRVSKQPGGYEQYLKSIRNPFGPFNH